MNVCPGCGRCKECGQHAPNIQHPPSWSPTWQPQRPAWPYPSVTGTPGNISISPHQNTC